MAVFHWQGTQDCRTDKLTKCVREREQIGASRRRYQAGKQINIYIYIYIIFIFLEISLVCCL